MKPLHRELTSFYSLVFWDGIDIPVFFAEKDYADWACNHIVVKQLSGYKLSDAFIKLNPRFASHGPKITDCLTKTALHRLRHKPHKCCSA